MKINFRGLIFSVSTFLVCTIVSVTECRAQSPGFRFGPRLGIGACRLSSLPGMDMGVGRAVQIGLVANRQITRYFGIEFCPLTAFYKANGTGNARDGVDSTGRARLFSFREDYKIGSVEFPLYAKFSIGGGPVYFTQLGGFSVGMNMFGIRSRQYDDAYYNQKHGYWDHFIHGIEDAAAAVVLGFGIEYETKKGGVLALDLRMSHTVSRMGEIDGKNFNSECATIGLSWKK
jgi:hypothetical protein